MGPDLKARIDRISKKLGSNRSAIMRFAAIKFTEMVDSGTLIIPK